MRPDPQGALARATTVLGSIQPSATFTSCRMYERSCGEACRRSTRHDSYGSTLSTFRSPLTVALASLALLTAAAPADATVSRKKAMWGPLEVNGISQFPTYADLGVGIYQMSMAWDRVALTRPVDPRDPTDSAYRWPAVIDRASAEGARYGIQVSLMVMRSPGWANDERPARWAPRNPQDFADFVAAASRRYPRVHHGMIWGEPTKADNFQPLPREGRRLRGKALLGPMYANMLDASYAALKRVDRRNVVIGGNTYTVGTVSPRRWIQALRLHNGRPPRMDLYGHNPFSIRRPNLKSRPLGHGNADFSDLDELSGWVHRNLRRRGAKRIRLFLSEFSLPTDHANDEFNFHLTRKTQASWLASALRITRRSPWIYTLGYLSLTDDALQADGQQVERGLIERSGRRKPAFGVFKQG
jgi:hypothetical protein